MTQEEKVKRYNEALERAKEWYSDAQIGIGFKANLEKLFPELEEDRDERIRKAIIEFFELQDDNTTFSFIPKKDILAWLEKQDEQKTIEEVNGEDYGIDSLWHAQRILEKTFGSVNGYQSDDGILEHQAAITAVKKLYEQKPVDKVEPKFHEGDWITNANGNYTWKVILVDDLDYTLQNQCGECVYDTVDYVNKAFHLWTIQDAKDGDVVCYKDEISLYKHDIKNCTKRETTFGGFVYHCCYDGKRFIMDSLYSLTEQDKMNIHPATKEQRDLLFTKMKEAGYEWDADKKELNKEEVK